MILAQIVVIFLQLWPVTRQHPIDGQCLDKGRPKGGGWRSLVAGAGPRGFSMGSVPAAEEFRPVVCVSRARAKQLCAAAGRWFGPCCAVRP